MEVLYLSINLMSSIEIDSTLEILVGLKKNSIYHPRKW